MKKRIVIGMSGASGAPLTLDVLRELQRHDDWESHLVVSHAAERTLRAETSVSLESLCKMADVCYDVEDIGAAIASGTFRTEGMIVVPCSMKTLAGIANGYADNLLLRAADVTLKQHRRLVLAVRETPMHAIHLRNLLEVVQMGAVALPSMMTFYTQPTNIDDMVHHITGKLLDEFGIETVDFRRWTGDLPV